MKKVLIITYYWPPSGGAGVQRWLKFVKYFQEFGWEPVIYTPENPESPVDDLSLAKDVPQNITVIKTKITEPYSLYKTFIGQKKEEKISAGFLSENKKPRLAEKISVWLRGNFFIPDARKFWIKPSVKFLSEYLKSNPVDAIISTGPPHSMHLIALGVKKKLNLPWIADFRDPWTNIDFYHHLMLKKSADAKHKKLEREVLEKADRVVTVSWNWAYDFKKIVERKVEVITNGFDEDDFKISSERKKETEFAIHHIGSINKDRNAESFWNAIKELVGERKDFAAELKVRLIGKNDFAVTESISKNNLERFVEKIVYVPHEKVISYLLNADVLYLPLNDTPNTLGVIPGKLFEYLAARKPILATGNENGDSARIINETKSGVVCNFSDKEKIKTTLLNYFEKHKQSKNEISRENISHYSRRSGCKQFATLLNEIAQ